MPLNITHFLALERAERVSRTRQTSHLVYWEGAAWALEDGKPVGRGYLELTSYGPAQPYLTTSLSARRRVDLRDMPKHGGRLIDLPS